MSEEQQGSAQAAPEGSGQPSTGEIGTGRKVRLAALFVLLLLLVAAAVAIRSREKRAEKDRIQEVADGVRQLREVIPRLDPDMAPRAMAEELARAGAIITRLEEIDPGNQEVAALTAAMLYQRGDTAYAVDIYNELGADTAESDYRRASLALADFQLLIVDAAGTQIGPKGLSYLTSCSRLWSLARRISEGAETDADRALAMCAWMASNLGTSDPETIPVDPSVTCARSYGSPVEMAWTFCELLRQVDVPSRVLVPPTEKEEGKILPSYIVEVLARDGAPMLVDTSSCAPLLRPGREPVTLDELRQDADLRHQIAVQAGGEADALEYIGEARRLLAIHPYTCYRRFIGFDSLLSQLPERPRIVLDFESMDPGEEIELWEAPVGIAVLMMSDRYPALSREGLAPLNMIPQRDAQLQGLPQIALTGYEQLIIERRDQLAQADAEEGIETLRRTLEMATFFEASATLAAGDPAGAVVKLDRFLEQYPESRFVAPASVLLAEAAEAAGDEDAALEAWQRVPPPRTPYARLRGAKAIRGLYEALNPGEAPGL